MSFVDFAMQAYGMKRPPKPSADQEASKLMCDPKKLCGSDKNTSCPSYIECVQKVAQVVDTNGLSKPFTSDGDVQKNVFISQHFEILNATKTDRSLSQIQAMLSLISAIPNSIKVTVTIVGSMFALMALVPAATILLELLMDKIELAKVITLLLFTLLVVGMYLLVPL
jgi:hypothetical protein